MKTIKAIEKIKIYQFELTNRCNSKSCHEFCPYYNMTRKKGNTTFEVVDAVINRIENNYICLHHFGEPTLHPNIRDIIKRFSDAGIKTEFSTNCINISTIIQILQDGYLHRMRLFIDPVYESAVEVQRMVLSNNTNTILHTHSLQYPEYKIKPKCDFAGQVDLKQSTDFTKADYCYFLEYDYCCVLFDGRIVPCCTDFDGKYIIGNIFGEVKFQDGYGLCEDCEGFQFADYGEWKK